MKSKIIMIALIIVLVIFIIVGKSYLDRVTFDYHDEVMNSLTEFYNSSDKKDLTPIIDILNSYKADSDIVKGVQDLCTKRINSWIEYLNGKYTCDYDNLEACKVQKSEYESLIAKIKILYEYRGNETTIILPSVYRNISTKTTDKLNGLDKVVNSARSKVALTCEEIRLNRCKVATDCNCRNGLCSCSYKDKNRNYSIVCIDKNYNIDNPVY